MPATRPLTTRCGIAVGLLVAVLAAACTSQPARPSPSEPASTVAPSPSPEPPAFEVSFDLRDVQAVGVAGRIPPRDLRTPTDAIVDTITEMYSIGFVDPERWGNGRFPGLSPLFAEEARSQLERDLQTLTLGRASRELDAVRPVRAVLDLRLVADGAERAALAVAEVRFRGVGLEGDDRRRIRHDGEYTFRRVNGRWRIVAYEVLARTIGPPGRAAFAPGLPSRDPMFILVIGSDARPGQAVDRTRADSLHIVGVNPRQGRASVLGIPRDAWVPIPGGGSDKINAALVRGGPELLVDTVERLSGIALDGYVLTGFAGYQDIVKAMGGVELRIPYPIDDRFANAHFREGRQHLSAKEALAFARVRHDLPNGDFGRSFNQGRLLVATLARLREALASRGPAALLPWVIAGARHLDTDLSLFDIADLLLAAPALEPRRVSNEVLTGRVGNVGGLSVVFLDAGAYARLRDLGRDGFLGN